MSNIENLRITVFHINSMLAKLDAGTRVRVGRSYNKVRLYVCDESSERDTPCIGPKDCLMFAEGMERALGLLYYGRER